MTGERETLEQQVYRVANEVLGYEVTSFEKALASRPFGQMCALVGAVLKEERMASAAECTKIRIGKIAGHSKTFVAGYMCAAEYCREAIERRIKDQL
jgi:hypothetical protein